MAIKELKVIKGVLIVLGGGFFTGYLWVYKPEIAEYSLIIGITMSAVIMTAVDNWFFKTIFFLLCGSCLILYVDRFIDDFKQFITMLLIMVPMASAMFLHVAEEEVKEKGDI
ncbi:hypothetical protein PJ311_18380 [Bacillus sp. CLL-7-23]|uniref:Uncharacterized protein n=1 Tax=Bacillus changyiensis TaxID=3004103 RepID=A0ABT4X8A3_9BACI|nr:hypothetical protein [Bacillus changyiensis]MDA1477283.1 hypothetical protein [Bacillus changyiensis]MDA7028509.1 hypothetical protein [Bacillus changyiensis]